MRSSCDRDISRALNKIQRRHGKTHIIVLTILGFLVGYFTLPSLHWFHAIVSLLAWACGAQLAIMRHQRLTWHYRPLAKLLDNIERICIGSAILGVNVYALFQRTAIDITIGVVVWTGFFVVLGTLCGECIWQRRVLMRADLSTQLRYICSLHRSERNVAYNVRETAGHRL